MNAKIADVMIAKAAHTLRLVAAFASVARAAPAS